MRVASNVSSATAIGALGLLVATGCAERSPAVNFPQLAARVKTGKTLYVIDDTGVETRGRLVALSSSALTLTVNGAERRMPLQTVRQVQTYGDPVWNGLLVGVAAGLPGAFIADPTYDPCPGNPQQQCANAQVGQRLMMLGFTGALGAGIDALIRGRHQVYLSPPAASARRLTITTQISRSAAAAAVTVPIP